VLGFLVLHPRVLYFVYSTAPCILTVLEEKQKWLSLCGAGRDVLSETQNEVEFEQRIPTPRRCAGSILDKYNSIE